MKRKGLHSTSTLLALAAGDPVEIPDGLTREEARLWPQFAATRARADWDAFALGQLTKIVKLEAAIAGYQEVLDHQSPVVRNAAGSPVPNPLFAIIDRLQRQQLSLMRALGIASKPDGRTLAGRASRGRTFTQHRGNGRDEDEDLFSRPH